MSVGRGHFKYDRKYSSAELANFAQYADRRARLKPPECRDCERCWVKEGPPAYRISNTNTGRCLGCGGQIRT